MPRITMIILSAAVIGSSIMVGCAQQRHGQCAGGSCAPPAGSGGVPQTMPTYESPPTYMPQGEPGSGYVPPQQPGSGTSGSGMR